MTATALVYSVAYIVPLVSFTSFIFKKWSTAFASIFLAFVLIPALDAVLGLDEENPCDAELHSGRHKLAYRVVLYVWPAVQWSFLFWAARLASEGVDLSVSSFIGLGLTAGLLAAQGVNVSHELFHKRNAAEVALGKAILVSVCYGHFYIEHLYGHHRRVATPEDPATARYGESFYAFFPRTVVGSFRSAWKIERERLAKRGFQTFCVENRILRYFACSVLWFLTIFFLYGLRACCLFLLHCFTAITLLEMVNYIEHYGLERAVINVLPNGEKIYEPVSNCHSWNSSHRLTNYILFKLQRHADHHRHADRPYHLLVSTVESPQLPAGYPTMIILLLFPALWRKSIHPILDRAKVPCDSRRFLK
ncbi:similar to alkane hydroxylase [Cyanidioschyzon merolae strain 10D]|jgi:alkane 1-monooxygenase|uniref:Similar to alkane hydroxylase n=1 Tax=Cyanidioschyzon merolae (strain NIES-3377 / 10D) TaxID=280699 RepID=M1VDZ7_CYAM1|nr:similar to alkane hydroxylase [Cyanidioschyzon merolae strain 10D]BAM81102.1 similar to alkane hydroxylase [Cyanidioschyzon merolae strain 10D]|eukprot:XP_005537138.1 similar to alkane hydroxylase [Cyanidioschyzon merolae strain 10D]